VRGGRPSFRRLLRGDGLRVFRRRTAGPGVDGDADAEHQDDRQAQAAEQVIDPGAAPCPRVEAQEELARAIAQSYYASREALGFPMLKKAAPASEAAA